MAEGRAVSKDDVVCRFFLESGCRDGDRCPFAHDSSRNIPDTVCRFFLQDKCFFGERCRYDHVLVKSGANSKNNSRSDKHPSGPSRMRSENRQTSSNHGNKRSGYRSETSHVKFANYQKNMHKDIANVGPGSANWVNAPEFVPKSQLSYADTLKSGTALFDYEFKKLPCSELCPYFMIGDCPFDTQCCFIHGDLCELCGKASLNPFDEQQRKTHIELCEKEIEQDMELSFAVQRSIGKTCGICMDIIMEKEPATERRFGILEKCNHIFCLSCIRIWRKAKQLENSQQIENALDPVVTRACPECRVSSDFITPSQYWVDTEEEKTKLIKDYKEAMGKKHCKYFKQGEGECPFGGACFYLHAKPDGTKVKLPPPTRRRRQNQDGDMENLGRILLWDYLDFREENLLMHLELDDFGYGWSESEEESSESG